MKTKNNKKNVRKAIVVGAEIAALVATGYFFFGPNGKKNRKATRDWMIKMKGEVIEKIKKAKNITENGYSDIVDMVAKKYISSADKAEIIKFTNELKGHWKYISNKVTPKTKKVVKKTSKK